MLSAAEKLLLEGSVSECLGIGSATISRIVANWNQFHDPTFPPTSDKRGHRPRSVAHHFTTEIREIIKQANDTCTPVSATTICDDLKRTYNVDVAVRTMRRVLGRMGFKHQKGKTRFYLAETEANVAFRAKYLRKKINNRVQESGADAMPALPETWVDESRLRKTKSGKGPRVCIVGAGIVKLEGDKLVGRMVESSLKMWPSQRRAKRKNRNISNDDDDDYHGNFNAELLEMWFANLCSTLRDTYGPTNIHMDGARYHKRNTTASPTSVNKKVDIQAWLTIEGIEFGQELTKAELLELVKARRRPPIYAAQVIATNCGHTLYYTPPYHPELQPIKLIWGAVKNKIARRPSKTVAELITRLHAHFNELDDELWVSAYRKVQGFEDAYLETVNETPLVEDDVVSNDGDDPDVSELLDEFDDNVEY
ncbi:hypothetical protein H257_11777 [Aphanomyces astaci]|uniref:Tc1-like transposase DDE domain-containing protein n=1 Tax=Aphanomyces astaci TaxID=112090 RepID=W4G417_APHAT|nr:hypothetical protein H257_11777 [Aphanomyces astaci]ETV73678.1 hypothetical protein H257_11777 [Aphanomyces astaci]|eukprot:XP_009837104.1 hypothetical protein H257_11777 [Aphanomyces astaci]